MINIIVFGLIFIVLISNFRTMGKITKLLKAKDSLILAQDKFIEKLKEKIELERESNIEMTFMNLILTFKRGDTLDIMKTFSNKNLKFKEEFMVGLSDSLKVENLEERISKVNEYIDHHLI